MSNAPAWSRLESGFHGDSEAEQRDCAKFWADHIRNVFVVINGDAVEDLDAHRFASPQFKFNAPTPWISLQRVARAAPWPTAIIC